MDESTGILTASEHYVIVSIFPTPAWVGMDTFSIHSTCTAMITWCIEVGNCRMIDGNGPNKSQWTA